MEKQLWLIRLETGRFDHEDSGRKILWNVGVPVAGFTVFRPTRYKYFYHKCCENLNLTQLPTFCAGYDSILYQYHNTKVTSASSRTIIVVPRWKKMRGEVKVTYRLSYCINLPCDTALWTRIFFLHECLFDFVFRFVSNGWQNRTTRLHRVLREAP